MVLDADTLQVVGDIPDTSGVHGIAIAAELGKGFTSNGRANTLTVFDYEDAEGHGRGEGRHQPGRDPLRRASRSACSRSTAAAAT